MDVDRRAVLRAGFTALSVASGMAVTTAAASAEQTGDGVEDMEPARLDGEIRWDEDTRAAAAVDFGHLIHRTPSGVLLPRSARDVAEATRWAGARGWHVAAQGETHSVYGRAQVSRGIVIDMSQLRTVHSVLDDRVVVDAGAKWSEVLAATLPKGLTPPVLADYLELSVGGTLVVGGIGGTTYRHGMQSDNVLGLDVVTGDGREVSCSPRYNADLFNAVRAGLAQVAIITRATLKLMPAPEQVRRYVLTYPSLQSLIADQRKLVGEGRFDALQGAILPTPTGWKYTLDVASLFSGGNAPDDAAKLAGLSDIREAAQLTTVSYFDYLNRLAGLEQLLRANGQWFHPHPWLTTYVGDAKIESLVAGELAKLTPADLGTYGRVVVSAIRRNTVTSPLLRLPADDVSYAFNLVRFPTTDDATAAQKLVTANRAVYERVRAAGGTLYPVSALPMNCDDWRRHFGSAWRKLSDAKQRYDCRHVLTPGYEVF